MNRESDNGSPNASSGRSVMNDHPSKAASGLLHMYWGLIRADYKRG